jgi:hypothetical protein
MKVVNECLAVGEVIVSGIGRRFFCCVYVGNDMRGRGKRGLHYVHHPDGA